MSDKYILDENRNPVPCEDVTRWNEWDKTGGRFEAKTRIGEVTVSTVFLSLSIRHGFGLPMLYETMVCAGADDDRFDGCTEQYATRDEALAGHKIIVEHVAYETGETPVDTTEEWRRWAKENVDKKDGIPPHP